LIPGPGLPPAQLTDFGEYFISTHTNLWRVHSGNFAATAFNPCLGNASRFAPLRLPNGICIPTLYAGTTQEAALFETVFRDLPLLPQPRRVRRQKLDGIKLSKVTPSRPLRLAPLFNQNLALIGQSRLSMIESHGTAAYAETARWAESIHNQLPGFDGLIWTSRQQDSALAMLLFGTRVTSSDLISRPAMSLDTGKGRGLISKIADTFRIDIIPS